MTFTDPATYAKPWGFTANMALAADTDMLESVCERSSVHWAGSLSDAANRAVSVAPDVLARYVGVYSGRLALEALQFGPLVRTSLRVRIEGLPQGGA